MRRIVKLLVWWDVVLGGDEQCMDQWDTATELTECKRRNKHRGPHGWFNDKYGMVWG